MDAFAVPGEGLFGSRGAALQDLGGPRLALAGGVRPGVYSLAGRGGSGVSWAASGVPRRLLGRCLAVTGGSEGWARLDILSVR